VPYYITNTNPDCSGWAVEKEDGEVIGCHNTKQGAIDQMVAVSIAEDIAPGGERALPTELEVGDYVSWNTSGGRARGEIVQIERDGRINVPNSSFTITGTPDDPAALIQVYQRVEGGWEDTDVYVGHKFSTLTKIQELPEPDDEPEDEDDDDDEMRQVDLTPPAYMRASARRGLQWYSEGLGGDGLVDRTIREAREMAEGRVSADKWVRIQAWIARHLVDLDAPDANPNSENFPSAGVVAMALWGGGTTKRSAQRAQAYAEGVVARLEAEEERGKMKHETRNFDAQFELREEGEGMTFVGYAAKFNSPSEDLGGFVETIEPGAFRRSLRSRNDVKLLVNHDTGRVLASSRSGTMRLYEDETGLRVEASLPNTSDGRDMAELLKRGDLNKMSFGFAVQKDSWNNEMTERTLKSVRLFEVSIVAFPAYAATEALVRSLDKAAKRAAVDADQLADAVLKLEEGADLSDSEAELIKTVVNSLTPTQVKEEDQTEEQLNLLDLKRKQLDLLLKRN
jgi:HK97 family phage prohead protease